MIDVPKTIKSCRKFRHITQRQLADRAMISRQTVWNVERENNGTTVYTFEKLLNAMGFRLDIFPLGQERDWRML